MIDADNLKVINDTYGHECGDAYLRQLASLLADFAPGHSTAARLGGDEFVLFLYQYQTRAALSDAVSAWRNCRTTAAPVCAMACTSPSFSLSAAV